MDTKEVQLESDQQEKGREMSQTVTLDEFQAHEVRVAVSVCQYDLQESLDYCDPDQEAEIKARIAIMQEVLGIIEVTYPNYELLEKDNTDK